MNECKAEIKGRVWKFGDNTSTDYIQPGFIHTGTPQEQAAYCMHAVRPDFARSVRPGDVIVGGHNFGCGSARPAAQNLITLGVSCVIAESFSRLFFRSSISLGFPVLYCQGIYDAFREGETLTVSLVTGEVKNVTSGEIIQATPLPEIAMKIIEAGGIVALLKEDRKTNKSCVKSVDFDC